MATISKGKRMYYKHTNTFCTDAHALKGVWQEIFDFRFFFINHCPLGPQVFHWGRFKFYRKFAEVFAYECLSPVSTSPVSTSPVSTTPAINLWAVSMTLENNLCHGFSMITGVVDTGDKFLTGDNDTGDKFNSENNNTGEQLSPVMTPVNNYRRWQRHRR